MSERTGSLWQDMGMELTSRYGAAGPPSWLRACHGECEGMGRYPIEIRSPGAYVGISNYQVLEWLDAHMVAGHGVAWSQECDGWQWLPECDGWHFIKCEDCRGAGRVSRLRAFLRIPYWFVRGCFHIAQTWSRQGDIVPLRLAIWCCLGIDWRQFRKGR